MTGAVIFGVINTLFRKSTAQWYLTSVGGTQKGTYIQLNIDQEAKADWNEGISIWECPFIMKKEGGSDMNNTALRAEVPSANNTHMVFADEEHEKFYYEKLEQARYQDCYHKALIYILGISEDTRKHFSQIYDIKSGYIKT